MIEMKKCRGCGEFHDVNCSKCPYCGAKTGGVSGQKTAFFRGVKICKTCGNSVARNAKICPHCGKRWYTSGRLVCEIAITLLCVYLVYLFVSFAVGFSILSSIFSNEHSNTSGGESSIFSAVGESGETTSLSHQGGISTGQVEETPVEAEMEIDAISLWQAYETEEKADDLYRGKWISVTGKVASVWEDFLNGAPYISLKGDTDNYTNINVINCRLPDNEQSRAVAATLSSWDIVTICGFCEGKDSFGYTVTLSDCRVETQIPEDEIPKIEIKTAASPRGKAIVVSAAALMEAYNSNPFRADQYYKDKLLMIMDTVQDVGLYYMDDSPYIYLRDHTNESWGLVFCSFPGDKKTVDEVAKIKEGSVVTIYGLCRGIKNVWVKLEDCSLE